MKRDNENQISITNTEYETVIEPLENNHALPAVTIVRGRGVSHTTLLNGPKLMMDAVESLFKSSETKQV